MNSIGVSESASYRIMSSTKKAHDVHDIIDEDGGGVNKCTVLSICFSDGGRVGSSYKHAVVQLHHS